MSSNSDSGGDEGGQATAAQPESFVERVLAVVDSIPPGRVMTYGEVAAVLGSRAARMVGQIMAHYGSDVPWWRVVRASGQPPANHEQIALPHYRAEATPLVDGDATAYRIDLSTARFSPLGEDHPFDR